MTTERIAGPAGEINVDDGGSGGLPVLFIHGFSGNLSHWAAQLDHLRSARRASAMDLRGHGKSPPPATGDYAVDAQAADVRAILDGLDLDRAVLVGHSLGGAIAISFAGSDPDRVAGLVLTSAPGKVPDEQAQRIITAMEADYETTSAGYWDRLTADATPQVLAKLRGEMGDLDPAAGLAIIKATFDFDPLPALRAYRGPKLAITTPRADAPHDLHNAVAGLPHREISGTSHFLQMDRPDEFNAMLDEFLSAVEAGATMKPAG